MRILVTGGSGVLGRALLPLLRADGHEVTAAGSRELDIFDPAAVGDAMTGIDAVYHLATRIPPPERIADADAWAENDRLRSEATPILVDAALAAGAGLFVLPSITFLYPDEGPADEDTPLGPGASRLSSMIDAESAVRRFAAEGGRSVILRLGLLWGPDTGNDAPSPRYGATLQIEDAGAALRAAPNLPAGIYNAVGDGQRISNARLKAASPWQPHF